MTLNIPALMVYRRILMLFSIFIVVELMEHASQLELMEVAHRVQIALHISIVIWVHVQILRH